MSQIIAALPMYDWPERRDAVDAEWVSLRDRLRAEGVDAPERLTRDDGDLPELWRSPNLLLAQTCWGPMEQGLAAHVQLVGQPDYSAFEGGSGEDYSSAIIVRAADVAQPADAPQDGRAVLPLGLLSGLRFAYNSPDSMSGFLSLLRDLESSGKGLPVFSAQFQSGSHRDSIRAVAENRADIAAIDCRTWDMARRFEPAASTLAVAGWTRRRKGLPFIMARGQAASGQALVGALRELSMIV